MKNSYEVRGDVTAIFIDNSNTGERLETLINTTQLHKVKSYKNRWYVNSSKLLYVCGSKTRKGIKESILLHRFITSAAEGLVVDHINGNTLDNTDSNLRVIRHSANMQNRKKHKNNVSGHRGVSWISSRGRWRAAMRIDGKQQFLGYFKDKEEAGRVAADARKKSMRYSMT